MSLLAGGQDGVCMEDDTRDDLLLDWRYVGDLYAILSKSARRVGTNFQL